MKAAIASRRFPSYGEDRCQRYGKKLQDAQMGCQAFRAANKLMGEADPQESAGHGMQEDATMLGPTCWRPEGSRCCLSNRRSLHLSQGNLNPNRLSTYVLCRP